MHRHGTRPRPGGEAATLTERTLARLRQDIVAGVFAAGSRMRSEDLKRRYEVGTSPVREALFQLVSEGLVHADGQRGIRVPELRADELADIADLRARLEGEALRRSIAAGDVEWEVAVLAALHRLRHTEARRGLDAAAAADLWEEHHRALHFALYGACGSPWLLRFCGSLIRQGERYRRAYIAYPGVSPAITAEHEAIVEAAVARDAELATARLQAHIRHAAGLAASLAGRVEG